MTLVTLPKILSSSFFLEINNSTFFHHSSLPVIPTLTRLVPEIFQALDQTDRALNAGPTTTHLQTNYLVSDSSSVSWGQKYFAEPFFKWPGRWQTFRLDMPTKHNQSFSKIRRGSCLEKLARRRSHDTTRTLIWSLIHQRKPGGATYMQKKCPFFSNGIISIQVWILFSG